MTEIVRRTIVGANDRDREAIVRLIVPAGSEIDIKPWWEFVGWADELVTDSRPLPRRYYDAEPSDDRESPR